VCSSDLFLYIWDNTYKGVTAPGLNWNRSLEGYLNLEVGTVGWSGLGFCGGEGVAVDLTGVTRDYTFHIAMKSTSTNTHLLTLPGGAGLEGSVAVGQSNFIDAGKTFVPYTDFARDGKWHLIEIPMSVFFDKGTRYPEPIVKDNYFTLLSGNNPGTVIGMDAIFIYKKSTSGIFDVKTDKLDIIVTKNIVSVIGATEPVDVYNLFGTKVFTSDESVFGLEELSKGVYIVKSGNATGKIVIK
jgi:hypothetical protein